MHMRAMGAIVPAVLAMTGCATITGDATQSVAVEVVSPSGEKITEISCEAMNDKGSWTVIAPKSVVVRRSAADLMVNCKKDGMEPGTARAVSRSNAGMWGNIIFGGGVGAIIDYNKGNGYTYPSWLTVQMGKTLTYDRHDEKDGQRAIAKENQPSGPAQPTATAQSTTSAQPTTTAKISDQTSSGQ